MKLSKAFFQSLREVPRDAEVVSHQLFARANLIRKHAAGIYSYLPFLVRSYHKLSQIIREELDHIGWQEVILPYVTPAELWRETGRWDLFQGLMLKLKDRKEGDFALGPTHEEVATDLVRSQVTSYKQLPLTLYQITPKFRDEFRPRFGLMRGREFVMMDGYSFHANKNDLDQHYKEVDQAYRNIFDRSGLKYVRVEADTGAIGGSGSHEFQVLADTGEDAILSCGKCDYAANVEKAITRPALEQKRDFGKPTQKASEAVKTPGKKTIEEVSDFLKVPKTRNIKTLVYRFSEVSQPKSYQPVIAFVLGHRSLNEVKLKGALTKAGFDPLDLSVMPEEPLVKLFGCRAGSLGPIGAPADAVKFFDREIEAAHDLVCGANRDDEHLVSVEPAREFSSANYVDLVNVEAGDLCPRCDGVLESHRGIEVGHIFKLGDKYSKAMKAEFQDDQKQTRTIEMGTYGIGVTRILAAAIEQNHDADGMVWPVALAPYTHILITLGQPGEESFRMSQLVYDHLRKRGCQVLWDDRDLSPGVKFKDADLLGIPFRMTLGKKGIEGKSAEVSTRKSREKRGLAFEPTDAGLDQLARDFMAMT